MQELKNYDNFLDLISSYVQDLKILGCGVKVDNVKTW